MLVTFLVMNLFTKRTKMEKDKHKIKLKFVYTHQWIDHPLRIALFIDDRAIHVDFGSNKSEVVIDKKVAIDSGEHTMKLQISNKNEANTKVNSSNEVIADSVVSIKEVCIDDINLMSIITEEGVFNNDQTSEPLTKITDLGHNGTWELKFKVPTYDWLLEKLF